MAENYIHRDRRTGLRILAGDYLEDILPDEIAFQLALKKHAEEGGQENEDSDDDIIDLEVYFCDVNCGVLSSDRRVSRCVLLTSRFLAIYTHNGVLKHKIALEDIKRIEFLTTQDDTAAAVLVVLREVVKSDDQETPTPLLPIVFSLLHPNLMKEASSSANFQQSSASVNSGTDPLRSPSTLLSAEEDAIVSPTARIADLRLAIGALTRLRAEEDNLEKVRERAAEMKKQTDADNEELLQDQQTQIIQDSPTQVNTIVVIATESAIKLDLLLRSLAGASIELANKGEEPAVAPLEVPRVTEEDHSAAGSAHDLSLVETVERLCRKEKDLAVEDAQESLNENIERQRYNGCFRSSAQKQGIESVIEGLNLWIGSRQNLVSARHAHSNCQSNLEQMMIELERSHEARNEQILRLADEAQTVANNHNDSINKSRTEVEGIDMRIKQMEQELQAVTDNFTEAMKEKDEEIQMAKEAVNRMRYNLTKGSYSELPSLADLQAECEKLDEAVAQQSARAEELHISAPDKSVLRHLTAQLEDENTQLQEDILNWKKQRRTISQQLISHRMDLSNAESRGEAATKKSKELRRRKLKAAADNGRLREGISVLDKRVRNLQQKLRRVELEAVVVEDLKREELMHRSMVQSVRQDIRSDLLEKRRVERMMKQEQDRRSKSREQAHSQVMGLE